MSDLWPSDLTEGDSPAPVTILRAQGTLLGQKTGNLVTGVVESKRAIDQPAALAYAFYLAARPPNPYRYQLFTIEHPIEFYPVSIHLETNLALEIEGIQGDEMIATSANEFSEYLRVIFAAMRTRQIIRAILAQNEGWVDDDNQEADDTDFLF